MKRHVPAVLPILIILLLLATACSKNYREPDAISGEVKFNLIFKYGVGAKNELNTFNGTYTKDMIVDPPITVDLSLSKKEMKTIYNKMAEINFFDYPDQYTILIPPGEGVGMVTPHSTYYFKVENGSSVKELTWEDYITNRDEKADKLRELIKVIRDIVESKREYKALPVPKGGYD